MLVLATGFKVDAFMRPIAIVGGARQDARAGVGQAPRGVSFDLDPRLPEFLHVERPERPRRQLPLIEVAELQLGYIMQLVSKVTAGECDRICATQAAVDEFEAARVAATSATVWATGCRSWYLDDRGVPSVWPWPFGDFRVEMAAPKLEAYELQR